MEKKVLIALLILVYLLGIVSGVFIMKQENLNLYEKIKNIEQEKNIYKNLLVEKYK